MKAIGEMDDIPRALIRFEVAHLSGDGAGIKAGISVTGGAKASVQGEVF